MRPWPAQSNSSRAPSVNELCVRLPRMETRSRPSERARREMRRAAWNGRTRAHRHVPESVEQRGDGGDHDFGGIGFARRGLVWCWSWRREF